MIGLFIVPVNDVCPQPIMRSGCRVSALHPKHYTNRISEQIVVSSARCLLLFLRPAPFEAEKGVSIVLQVPVAAVSSGITGSHLTNRATFYSAI